MEFHLNRIVLNKGEVIDGYKIACLLGQGGYGDVYKVTNSHGKEFAMKTEYLNSPKKALESEIKIIKKLHSPYFPKYYSDGETKDFKYLIVDTLGPSIGDIQKLDSEAITTEFTYNFALQSLSIIEKLHECGYIHRDIKPTNFLLKRDQKNPLNLIDFGISKPFINFENGEILEPVPSRYKGTRKYASVNSHNGKDLGRCDDLFSWFYCIIEMKMGKLPWNDIRNYDEVKKMKQNQVSTVIKPYPELVKIYDYLIELKFKDKPDYDFLRSIITEKMEKDGFNSESFNWIDFYDKMKKLKKPIEVCPNNQNKNDNKIDINKKETVNQNNFAVNKIHTNQFPSQQNEKRQKKVIQEEKHNKHNKKVKKSGKNHKNKSDGKDCLLS